MTYARTATVVDTDSVQQGCLDLDTDLSLCFTHLNTLSTSLADKITVSRKGAPGGVCELDGDGLVPVENLPEIPAASLPANQSCPTGTIQFWAGVTVPEGWVECDGRWLSQEAYANLFAVIGATYGANAQNFHVPDARGFFARGWSHASGVDPDAASRPARGDGAAGDRVGTPQTDSMLAHVHNFKTNGSLAPGGTQLTYLCPGSAANAVLSTTGGTENRPANICLMYIIKI